MDKRIKWSEDFKRYPERRWPYKGLRGVAKAIAQVLLVLCALYAIYVFFGKAELNPAAVKSSAVEAKPDEAGVLNLLGKGSTEAKEGFQDEDMG